MASKKTPPTHSSPSSLIDEVEQTAESVLRHVGDLVGKLSHHVADAAQSVADTTTSVKDAVFSPESGARQQVMKLVAEVENAGQELSDRAGDLFENLLQKVVAAEHRPAQKRAKKKKKPVHRTVRKKVGKKKKKVAKKTAKQPPKSKVVKKKSKVAKKSKKKGRKKTGRRA